LTDQSSAASVSATPTGGVGAAYVNDQYKPWAWLTLNAGIRLTHFSGITDENAANPRAGATVQVPKLKWVLRSFYGTYYQAPPLYTVGGGLFGFGLLERGNFGFSPLKGERDIQREFGLTIPIRGWILDVDHFATSAQNFLDHDVLGNSNILLPLTTPAARIKGTEVVLRSPAVIRKLHFHAAYSNMTAQFRGAPDGGLIEPVPNICLTSYCFLDHDQRNTLSTGFEVTLPRNGWFSTNLVHGSGVLAGDGPAHLPPNTTADLTIGKSIAERWTLSMTALNISNSRYPFSVNSSFAGTHFNNPREIIGSVRYRFHF
jgi:outer membrane receptor protein involved in Fe transport